MLADAGSPVGEAATLGLSYVQFLTLRNLICAFARWFPEEVIVDADSRARATQPRLLSDAMDKFS